MGMVQAVQVADGRFRKHGIPAAMRVVRAVVGLEAVVANADLRGLISNQDGVQAIDILIDPARKRVVTSGLDYVLRCG